MLLHEIGEMNEYVCMYVCTPEVQSNARFDVLTAVLLTLQVAWDVTWCCQGVWLQTFNRITEPYTS